MHSIVRSYGPESHRKLRQKENSPNTGLFKRSLRCNRMEHTIAKIAELVGGDIQGDGSVMIRGVAPFEHASSTDITLLVDRLKMFINVFLEGKE